MQPSKMDAREMLTKCFLEPKDLERLSQEQRLEYHSILDQIEWIIENERLRLFRPNGAQKRWIEDISKPGLFIGITASGNGAGKTYGIIGILGALIWKDLAPECFYDFKRQFCGPKRARIISTPKELEDIGSLQTTIKELWPKNRYVADKAGKTYLSRFWSDTGWIVDLMSYEQSSTEFAGANLGVVVFNEPPPEAIYKESIARLRKRGICLMAMTSLSENTWVVDGLLGKANGKDLRVVYGDIEDNCSEHSKNGVLDHSQIERILAQYDPDEREARKTGKPLRFSGRIFKVFDRSFHVSKEPIVPPETGVEHYMVVDPAIGKPLAVIWAYIDATKTIHVYDEWPDFDFQGSKDSNMTVSDYVQLFKSREENRNISNRILDRHFGNVRRTLGGLTLKQEFNEQGLEFIDSYKMDPTVEVETGILKVKEYLKYDPNKPMDSINTPRLVISPKCRNVINSLERWSRDPKTGKPQEEYKDFSDCLRYLCSSNPEVQEESKWEKPEQAYFGVRRND